MPRPDGRQIALATGTGEAILYLPGHHKNIGSRAGLRSASFTSAADLGQVALLAMQEMSKRHLFSSEQTKPWKASNRNP
jgi:hypothetical protein